MSERYLIIGYGSIGQRHARNLLQLLPDAALAIVDPFYHRGVTLDEALEYPDLKGAIVASQTDQHIGQLERLHAHHLPTYLEKPVCTIAQYRMAENRDGLAAMLRCGPWRCALGFQYRYHPVADRLAGHNTDHLSFAAQDDLLKKYGRTVAETMASHSLDLALFAQGPARHAELETDGRAFRGTVHHTSGATSDYDLHIDRGPRQSKVEIVYERGGQVTAEIGPDDTMYAKALRDWLGWIHTQTRPARLATLADGVRVMELIGRMGM